MTQDEVIELAISVGAATPTALFGRTDYVVMTQYELERFANLVTQHEREACATICEEIEHDRYALFKGRSPYTGKEDGRASHYVNGESDGAGMCANAIRSRGENK